MDSRGWTASVVGNLSKWMDLDAAAEKVFKQEVAWASHLSVPAVMLPTPRHAHNSANYARVLNQSLTQVQYLQFWVRIPLTAKQQSNAKDPMEVDPVAGLRAAAMMETDDEDDAAFADPCSMRIPPEAARGARNHCGPAQCRGDPALAGRTCQGER